MKKFAGDIIILPMCTKNHNHDVQFLICRMRQAEFFVILGAFLPFYTPSPTHSPHPTPNNPENINFEKNEKHAWRYYPFMHTYVP